jgi:hypothetical protein
MASIATVACVTLSAGSAQASAIDNPGLNCTFKFDQNSSIPFLAFSNGKSATNLSTVNYFTADTDSAGNMGFVGSTMQAIPTNALVNSHTVSVRLVFTDVVGTTDLSGTHPNISWAMTAKAQFVDATDGISTLNCQTGTFTISITGDWGNTTSSAFTIPALSGSGSGACNGWSSAVNTALGLGTSGATLTLYKFGAYNGTTPLFGS